MIFIAMGFAGIALALWGIGQPLPRGPVWAGVGLGMLFFGLLGSLV